MRLRFPFAMVVLVAALAGCVGDAEEPAPAEDAAGADAGAGAADSEGFAEAALNGPDGPVAAPDEWELVDVPVTLEGESPPGLWVCAAAPVLGDCEVMQTQDTTYMFDVPFEGALTGWDLTITSPPATPENPGMLLTLRIEEGDDVTWMGDEGPSPLTFQVSDLEFSEAATLRVMAYTMPDADVGGDLWVDPVAQPYTIEGVLRLRVPA